MEFKDKLKKLRADSALTQEDLAKQLFVSRTLISKWESGDRFPSKDNLARLAVLFEIPQDELIVTQKEKDKYKKYNALSIAYSAVCVAIALGLVALMIIALIERATQNNGWTGVGGLIVCTVFLLPVILVLVLLEAITLRKKNGYKSLELYSLFTLLLVWLVSIPAYLFMI